MTPRVLFVSKPIVPPWNDGSKNLVRDVANGLTRARPTVLTTRGPRDLLPHVLTEEVYETSGRFAPGIEANARVLLRLLKGDPHDVWHFVFAPNPASSYAGTIAAAARRALGWRGKVVQTVPSAPKNFEGVSRLLFGDVIVALSEWTRGRLLGSGVHKEVRVIPPCAKTLPLASETVLRTLRDQHGWGNADIVLYPGDYEVSSGAKTCALAAKTVLAKVPSAHVVFACRTKTDKAETAKAAIDSELRQLGIRDRVTLLGEVADMGALIQAAKVIAFPVDDLYGKVDLPLVLLEALALEVPMVVAKGGPLEEIRSARVVAPKDPEGTAAELVQLLVDAGSRSACQRGGKDLYKTRFAPEIAAKSYDDLYEELLRI